MKYAFWGVEHSNVMHLRAPDLLYEDIHFDTVFHILPKMTKLLHIVNGNVCAFISSIESCGKKMSRIMSSILELSNNKS